MSSQELPQYFTDALSVLTESQKVLLIKLYTEWGQKHLFEEECFNTASPPSMRRQLATQLELLDKEYQQGGLYGYIQNVRKLLEDARNGVNPLEGWTPSVPVGEFFELGTEKYKEHEAVGLSELGSVGFVLVAGGLGERLGYNGIKVRCEQGTTAERI
jgi:UDP-sugar pyrophosphorylase